MIAWDPTGHVRLINTSAVLVFHSPGFVWLNSVSLEYKLFLVCWPKFAVNLRLYFVLITASLVIWRNKIFSQVFGRTPVIVGTPTDLFWIYFWWLYRSFTAERMALIHLILLNVPGVTLMLWAFLRSRAYSVHRKYFSRLSKVASPTCKSSRE